VVFLFVFKRWFDNPVFDNMAPELVTTRHDDDDDDGEQSADDDDHYYEPPRKKSRIITGERF